MKTYEGDFDNLFSGDQEPATAKQISFIQTLCNDTGTEYQAPANKKEASEMITLLKDKKNEMRDHEDDDWLE